MSIEHEIRNEIDNVRQLKIDVGDINNHLSILEGLCRERNQKQLDDAYQRGLEDGKKATYGLVADASSAEYQRGLDDAWEVARKIADMWETMDNDDLLETFGVTARIGESVIRSLFKKQTANEAMLELEAYEEKQKAEDEIKVGDEVRHERGWTAVVTSIDNDGFSVMDYNGEVASYSDISKFTKTGRHFDIPKILEEMRT